MQNHPQTRHYVTGALLTCYLIPILLLVTYSALWIPPHDRLQMLAMGILCAMTGTVIVTLGMKRWELSLTNHTAHNLSQATHEVSEPDDEAERLQQTLSMSQELQDSLAQELQQQQEIQQQILTEKDDLQHQVEQLTESLSAQHERFTDLLKAKEGQIQEYQQTIFDQQTQLEKRQKQVITLENTARDLKYELKTLIDLTDRIQSIDVEAPQQDLEHAPSPPPEDPGLAWAMSRADGVAISPIDPTTQLKRCINMAQKLTGARHLTGHLPRFQDLSVDGYALDLRRLCDSLSSEGSNLILLYSQKDAKLLFVSERIRGLLGWTPEKFVQDFASLVTEGQEEWFEALHQSVGSQPSQVTIAVKSRAGDSRHLLCHVGVVPTGIFKMHVVVIAQQVTSDLNALAHELAR